MKYFLIFTFSFFILFSSCSKKEELSLEELEALNAEGLAEILANTVSKPLQGQEFVPGKVGGTWHLVITADPKSFNNLIAEQDGNTSTIVRRLNDYFLDYDYFNRKWKPRIVSPEIIIDEKADTLTLIYTLRDDLYWSYYNSDKKVKVTSDDVIFWYDEIEGDPDFHSSGYYGQFLTMPDGTEARITIHKIDDRRFYFHFPRIIAEPLLTTNMDFGAKHVFEPAKRQGGVEAVRDLFNVSVDPKTIPSMGPWFIAEYTPGQRLVFKRNPDYWLKDANGASLPYPEELIARIIPDENTQLLLFKNSQIESYLLRPEDLDGLLNRDGGSYTIFNSEGSLGASFWSFNQNPVNSKKPQFEWFTQKEFRQAMSCMLNRERLNVQVYRGLAEPKLSIFPEPNPFFNPDITMQYLYDPERALELLSSIGIKRDSRGVMRDSKNRKIEFDLTIQSDSTLSQDIASIVRDELSKIGIKLNIRVVDFQKQVELVFTSFDWDSIFMTFGSANIFPTQGSNTWPTSGNLHLWHPKQEKAATEWEARIDYLYNEGKFMLDHAKAQIIWDEFQQILLEELPMIHLMRSRRFWAINNRWDLTNVYFDNMNSYETDYVFLKN